MNRIFSFVRSELFLSIAGGFALGLTGMALVKPASAGLEKNESHAVLIEGACKAHMEESSNKNRLIALIGAAALVGGGAVYLSQNFCPAIGIAQAAEGKVITPPNAESSNHRANRSRFLPAAVSGG